ncbi:Soluble aldose sugar dehydrogenase YliI precursor [Posidoniimonas corsicana]|uniref:Soluble aldose sugar dehydrogenase YliI n=1 Tax=Posidoniimonas corsicana TaxID=1938618 RepID=A0A5C5V5S5_9BACT|nr:PQQ-dependent sugar dehydrogenase [Posidoniimonas corsicana]TWT33914.1 Soluble aldose sugar dehydrogenase YliI precursor [Posidoniimonas corsicana]
MNRPQRAGSLRARQPRRLTYEQLEVRQLLTADVFLVNFQPEASFAPTRHLIDSGETFSAQDGNLRYGWNLDHTDAAAERNASPDQRLDTLIEFRPGGVWELQLPNGEYEVTVSVGDPNADAVHYLLAEGQSLLAGEATAAGQFVQAGGTISVTDGRLTLQSPSAADNSTCVNYVYVVGAADASNQAPSAPVIQEPSFPGQVVNPSDVHMEAVGYADPDGNLHANSDWEIWTTDSAGAPLELAWTTIGIGGVERLHTHLGDGVFVNSHSGRGDLMFGAGYLMRVRFRDDGGAVSPWGERVFLTGSATEAFPLELEGVAADPPPHWLDGLGREVDLSPALQSPYLLLESAGGETLIAINASGAPGNSVTTQPMLDGHVDVRLTLFGGSGGLTLGETDLHFVGADGVEHEVYLPAVDLPAGETLYLWVASNGSTFFGSQGQQNPDFSSLARASILGFVALEPGYRVEVAAEGLRLPVNIAFVPNPGPDPDDPQFYVTELYGSVKVVLNNGEVREYASDLLNYNPTGNFPGSGEQGVAGIVVDPASGDVFITRATDADGIEGGPHHGQVVRLHSTDEGRSSSGETVILDMVGETQGQSHQISDISIGPDGNLYVHNGDGFDATTALDLDSFRGKILSLDLDGAPAATNPFYDPADGLTARDFVFAYGFRNPFGGAWRAEDGMLYEVENGPGNNDRLARVESGEGYGWNGSGASMTQNAIYNWTRPHAPVDIAFVQPETFNGSAFPAVVQDTAFVTESGPTWAAGPQENGKRIVRFEIDANGDLADGPIPFVEYQGQGRASVAGIAAGPDGLYFSDLYADLDMQNPTAVGARILRVRYVGLATGSADFISDVRAGDGDLTVQFTDTSTVVGATQWEWDFGDGSTSSDQNPAHTYATQGVFDVRLTVTSEQGERSKTQTDYIVAGYALADTNQDGVVDHTTDVANFVSGWLTTTTGLTTQQALEAGDNNLDGIVDSSDAFRLRRALFEAAGSGGLGGEAMSPLQGDYNLDQVVDQDDYSVWREEYGRAAGSQTALRADGNGDGRVDAADYSVWRDNLGATLTSEQISSSFTEVESSEPRPGMAVQQPESRSHRPRWALAASLSGSSFMAARQEPVEVVVAPESTQWNRSRAAHEEGAPDRARASLDRTWNDTIVDVGPLSAGQRSVQYTAMMHRTVAESLSSDVQASITSVRRGE